MLAYKPLGGSAASDHLDLTRGGAAILVMLGQQQSLGVVTVVVKYNYPPLTSLVSSVTIPLTRGDGYHAVARQDGASTLHRCRGSATLNV